MCAVFRKSHSALYRLALLCIAVLAACAGCATGHVDRSKYVRDGIRYGVTEGLFRERWWNYYERGCSFLDGGFYSEAERDLRVALTGRKRDQLWPRTYGLHFIPEYFPHRELGIALFQQGRIEEAISELQMSLGQRFSARAAYYLNQARTQQIRSTGADKEPPSVTFLAPDSGQVIGTARAEVRGMARDDTFIAGIVVKNEKYDVKVSAPEVAFSCEVALEPGTNQIAVVATDVSGKSVEALLRIETDLDGPVVSFDTPLVVPGGIRGAVQDASGVKSVRIGERQGTLSPLQDNTWAFSAELSREDLKPPLRYEAVDSLGNITSGTLPVDLVQLGSLPYGRPVFASNYAVQPLSPSWNLMVLNGQIVALAAVQQPSEQLSVKLALRDGQVYFMDEIVVSVDVTSANSIQSVALNGEPLAVLSGRSSQRISRRVRLQEGLNEIVAVARDLKGNTIEDRRVLERKPSDIEMTKGKLAVAFLENVAGDGDPLLNQEADNMMDILATTKTLSRRFTVVDRSLIHEVLREQELAAAMSTLKSRMALGKIVPAEIMFAARVRKDRSSTEIVLQGVSTESGIRVMPRVDVAGPSDRIAELTETLGIRVAQEFPRVRGTVVDVAEGKVDRIKEQDERIPAVFIAEILQEDNGVDQDGADVLLSRLEGLPEIRLRFAVVDRTLIQEVLNERTLSEYLADVGRRLTRDRLVPAQVAFSLRATKKGDQLHLLLTGVSTETGGRVGEAIELTGPAADSQSLSEQLGRRLAAEFPRLKPMQVRGKLSRVIVDMGRTQGIRENLKCLLFRMEEVRDEQSGETLGTKPKVMLEGTIESVNENTSTASLVMPEQDLQSPLGRIEAGQYVITK
jgi:curli biogenesis system outer membrane secretion channel CsgG